MNDKIRELFEKHTVPNFAVGDDLDLSKNFRGEYVNPTLEDHWQTFQEAAELVVRECAELMKARKYADPDDSAEHYVNQGLATGVSLIKQHFGVER